MPKLSKITKSFNAGELSPLMDSRSDQQKYDSGAKTMENFIPLIYGTAERRPGLEYIADAKSDNLISRIVPFEHSVGDTYVLEFSNQSIRFFKDGAIVTQASDTDNLHPIGGLVAHWRMEEDAANAVVSDDAGANAFTGTLTDGTSNVNTSVVAATGQIGDGSFDLDAQYVVEIGDSDTMSFIDSLGEDTAFSISAWVNLATASDTVILSKWDASTGVEKREWSFSFTTKKPELTLFDESANATQLRRADVALSTGWRHVVVTYDGSGGASAADGIIIYADGSLVASTSTTTDAGYVDMKNLTSQVLLGALEDAAGNLDRVIDDKIDSVAVFNKVLTAAEVALIFAGDFNYERTSPYLTADIPSLRFEQSADVMFITHSSYEPRELSRLGDTNWTLKVSGLQTGPFRDQNTDTTITLTPSATTGSITLTATGGNVFTSGHEPSGVLVTSKAQTGALFKLVHASGTPSVAAGLDTGSLNATHTALAVPKAVTWDWTTNGTWGTAADSATVSLERSYDSGVTYETVAVVSSAANKNIVTSGTEDVADAQYRARVSEAGGDASICSSQFSVRDVSHIGIAKITAVASPISATATVIKTLGSTDLTHRWSEGSFSNRRGFPIDVTISSEERLTFAGNTAEPLTTWGSAVGDFVDFALGTNDSDAIQFTLVGTGQQNRVRWMLSKDVLVLGTVGGEHLLGASKNEEALTPTNVKAKLQTTYGSEDIAAILVNQATLFIQRGGKKLREFLYNFQADSHKADDLTVFAEHISGDGFKDIAFQRTPDPTLWCIRSDGEIAAMTYERDQDIFSWYRMVTGTDRTLAGYKDPSLVGHWELNDVAVTTNIIDSSINANDGTLTSSTAFALSSPGAATGTNRSIDFSKDGGDHYVEVPDQDYYSFVNGATDSPFSIALWADVTTNTNIRSLFTKDDGITQEYFLEIGSDHKPFFDIVDQSASMASHQIEADDALAAGWHHIVVTYDGTGGATAATGMKMYIDGILVDTTITSTGSYTAMESGLGQVGIGAFQDATLSIMDAGMDDVRLYSKELTSSEIDFIYNSGNGTENTIPTSSESIAVIFGGVRQEDEVWLSVRRVVNGIVKRTIERFRPRLLPSEQKDYRFLDSSITDRSGSTTISGLDHLEGEEVQVLGDGVVQTEAIAGDFTVTSGNITVPSGLVTVQVGLGYTSTLIPMDLDIEGTGLSTTKRINRAIVNMVDTIGGEIGPDLTHLKSIPTGTTLFTGHKEIPIPGGYSRDTDITIRQTDPLPMTVLSISYDLGANND